MRKTPPRAASKPAHTSADATPVAPADPPVSEADAIAPADLPAETNDPTLERALVSTEGVLVNISTRGRQINAELHTH
jgi:hypothetical protein